MDIEEIQTKYEENKTILLTLEKMIDKVSDDRSILKDDIEFFNNEFSNCLTLERKFCNEQKKLEDKIRYKESILSFVIVVFILISSFISFLGSSILIASIVWKLFGIMGILNDGTMAVSSAAIILGCVGITKNVFEYTRKLLTSKLDKDIELLENELKESEQYQELEFLKKEVRDLRISICNDLHNKNIKAVELKYHYGELKEYYNEVKKTAEYLYKQIYPTEMTTSLIRSLGQDSSN